MRAHVGLLRDIFGVNSSANQIPGHLIPTDMAGNKCSKESMNSRLGHKYRWPDTSNQMYYVCYLHHLYRKSKIFHLFNILHVRTMQVYQTMINKKKSIL